jgi:hypothetical protein
LSGKAPTGHAGLSVERIGQLFVATGELYILIADFFDGRLQFEIQMLRYWGKRLTMRALDQLIGGNVMRTPMVAPLTVATLVWTAGAALAHRSFAMFDKANPLELEGVVKQLKYVSPHSFILLEVKDKDGGVTIWNLEGVAPSGLARKGWSKATLKPGDEIKLTIDPLRSGLWTPAKVKFKNGEPILIAPNGELKLCLAGL